MTLAATPADPTSFEARVSRRARQFDVKALLDLLARHGYGRGDVLFESTQDDGGGGLVQAVEFQRAAPRVKVTLRLGLLGDNSLLPSYFFEVVEKSPWADRFYDFIRFFDHKLIENYLRAVYPENDVHVYEDFEHVRRCFLKMTGLGSISTLHWLAQTQFPELRVAVKRHAFSDTTESHALRMGISQLDGTAVLGRVYEADSAGFLVDLYSEDEVDARGRSWAQIVRSRLDARFLPLLEAARIPLIVRLTILFHATWARLDAPGSARGYLSYERIRGDAEAGHTLVIYRGVTGDRAER